MTTVIRLDGSALAKLIELDPEFKLELQRSILAEIAGKLYKNDIATDVRKLLEEVFQGHRDDLVRAVQEDAALRAELDKKLASTVLSVRAGGYGYTTQKKLPDELRGLLNRAVEEKINDAVAAQVGTVDRRVKEATDLLAERLEERISRMGGTLEHDWKVEALRAIREDVAKTIAETFGAKN
jgi:hypothetical protein